MKLDDVLNENRNAIICASAENAHPENYDRIFVPKQLDEKIDRLIEKKYSPHSHNSINKYTAAIASIAAVLVIACVIVARNMPEQPSGPSGSNPVVFSTDDKLKMKLNTQSETKKKNTEPEKTESFIISATEAPQTAETKNPDSNVIRSETFPPLMSTLPESEKPEIKTETKKPTTKAPETKAPPSTNAPETNAPETKAPSTEPPQTQAPSTEAPPSTKAPETGFVPQIETSPEMPPSTGEPVQTEAEATVGLKLPCDLTDLDDIGYSLKSLTCREGYTTGEYTRADGSRLTLNFFTPDYGYIMPDVEISHNYCVGQLIRIYHGETSGTVYVWTAHDITVVVEADDELSYDKLVKLVGTVLQFI